MDNEKKQKILNGLTAIPSRSIVNYILRGEVTAAEVADKLAELHYDEKLAEINKKLSEGDEAQWAKAKHANTASAFAEYLRIYPEGLHASDCMASLSSLDDTLWQQAKAAMSADSLNQYLQANSNGIHAQECRDLLADLPWLEARKQGTIASLQQYQAAYPGQHTVEIASLINDLNDESDWRNAEAVGQTFAYQNYLSQHPSGRYTMLAQNAIMESAGRDEIIDKLQDDINAYSASQLQREVKNHRISWDDLAQVFSDEEIQAIKDKPDLVPLPTSEVPEQLKPDTTEIYFWGTPSSGKTCALGAILSAANSYGILTKENCNGSYYMDRLCSTFSSHGICNLPEGSPDDVIQEMCLSLRDNKRKQHHLTLIDMAGETFRAMYRRIGNISETNPMSAMTLEQAKKYLGNERNKKIHFFIVAYGEENKYWEDEMVPMVNYLESSMQYLRQERIMRRSTNGVYLLVTKADTMPCAPEDRAEFAEEYVSQYMPSFYNSLKDVCHDSGVSDFQVLPFSVGRVFAQTLCHFESDNTDEVINKLIAKSATEKGWIKNIFNS